MGLLSAWAAWREKITKNTPVIFFKQSSTLLNMFSQDRESENKISDEFRITSCPKEKISTMSVLLKDEIHFWKTET